MYVNVVYEWPQRKSQKEFGIIKPPKFEQFVGCGPFLYRKTKNKKIALIVGGILLIVLVSLIIHFVINPLSNGKLIYLPTFLWQIFEQMNEKFNILSLIV